MKSFTVRSYWESYNELSTQIKKQADAKFELWKGNPFHPYKAAEALAEALETETMRLSYAIKLAKRRLSKFEKKYNVTSRKFMEEWSAEDLERKDLEYVEWAGEYNLTRRLNERLSALKSIEYVR